MNLHDLTPRFLRSLRPPALALLLLLVSGSPLAAGSAPFLEIASRDSFLPGTPVLVRLALRTADGDYCREVWDCEALLATLEGATLEPDRALLRNGVGSALVTIEGDADVTLTAFACGLQASRRLVSLQGTPLVQVSGSLPSQIVEWHGIVHVTSDVTVPPGGTLRILPGTLVLVDGVVSGTDGVDIDVRGRLESLGTSEQPVTFTARDTDRPWGEIHHDGAAPSVYRHTIITRAGNSPRGGHTNSGPALRPCGSRIVLEDCSVSDNAGKILEASDGSDLEIRRCLFARSTMGPETRGTALLLEASYILEMFGNDDNDGIYLGSQQASQEIVLRDCVVAAGDDDAIDTLGSDVVIDGCITRDFADKGISVNGGEATIRGLVSADNDIGVSAKNGGDVLVDRSTLAGNRLGVQARADSVTYSVTSSIILKGPGETAASVESEIDPANVAITYSDLSPSSLPWENGQGNITLAPLFIDAEARDFRLRPDSPCIDAGDPAGPLDADGTLPDMGAFSFVSGDDAGRFERGDVNRDRRRDLSDAVNVLLHLFRGRELSCEDAADLDDNGVLNVTDPMHLLAFLFRGGPPPAAPAGGCGLDPTPDALGCPSGGCAP